MAIGTRSGSFRVSYVDRAEVQKILKKMVINAVYIEFTA
jgi:hypothetical protein